MEPLTVIPGFGVFPPEHTCDGADRVALGRAMKDTIRQYGEAVAVYGRAAEVRPRC